MIIPQPKDAVHKAWLYRLLEGLLDDNLVSENIMFKGGTCAAMLGWLDRFSVDLDFDLKKEADKKLLRKRLHNVFKKEGLALKDESRKALQFFLKYPVKKGRNTIKLDIIDQEFAASQHKPYFLSDIDRFAVCQTKKTMFAHKLAALTDRFKKFGTIAARDIYDIHHFFYNGFSYNKKLLKERTGLKADLYLAFVYDFIKDKVSQKIIDQDLNVLLRPEKFKKIRKKIKQETLMFLKDEIERLKK
jgi:predicted nucleotidyltransferase component of viral defense system